MLQDQKIQKRREESLELWAHMWLEKKNLGIEKIFTPDCHYIESWGPEYYGALEVAYWFDEWNHRATVVKWDITQFIHDNDQTVILWKITSYMKQSHKLLGAEGMSLIHWSHDNRIIVMQDFICKPDHYDPYKSSKDAQYRKTSWISALLKNLLE